MHDLDNIIDSLIEFVNSHIDEELQAYYRPTFPVEVEA